MTFKESDLLVVFIIDHHKNEHIFEFKFRFENNITNEFVPKAIEFDGLNHYQKL